MTAPLKAISVWY